MLFGLLWCILMVHSMCMKIHEISCRFVLVICGISLIIGVLTKYLPILVYSRMISVYNHVDFSELNLSL